MFLCTGGGTTAIAAHLRWPGKRQNAANSNVDERRARHVVVSAVRRCDHGCMYNRAAALANIAAIAVLLVLCSPAAEAKSFELSQRCLYFCIFVLLGGRELVSSRARAAQNT
jgi:hypothetical protein